MDDDPFSPVRVNQGGGPAVSARPPRAAGVCTGRVEGQLAACFEWSMRHRSALAVQMSGALYRIEDEGGNRIVWSARLGRALATAKPENTDAFARAFGGVSLERPPGDAFLLARRAR